MIRLALIGCGAWGWRYIPAAAEAGNCIITHVAGVGESCPAEARQYLRNVEIVHNGKLLRAPVDAFIVAAPPEKRLSTTIPLLASRRPVMVEKPLALSANEANRIVAAAERAGVPLLVNHQHLFAPAYERLRDIVSSWGALTIRTAGEGPGPHRDYAPLWDYGPHDVAMALGLVESGQRAHVTWGRPFRRGERGEGADFELRAPNLSAQVTVSNCWPTKVRSLWVQAQEGFAHYDDMTDRKLMVSGHPVEISRERPLTLAVRAFSEAVRTGHTDWRFGRFGADVVGILDQAQHLLDRQREVHHADH